MNMYIVLLSLLCLIPRETAGSCLGKGGWCSGYETGQCCAGMYCNEWGINECEYCIKPGDPCTSPHKLNQNEEQCCTGSCYKYLTSWSINYFKCPGSNGDIDPFPSTPSSPPWILSLEMHPFMVNILVSFITALVTICCVMVLWVKLIKPCCSKLNNKKVVKYDALNQMVDDLM
eukprot:409485_1